MRTRTHTCMCTHMHTLSKHMHFPLSWRLGDQGLSIDSMKGGGEGEGLGGLWALTGLCPSPLLFHSLSPLLWECCVLFVLLQGQAEPQLSTLQPDCHSDSSCALGLLGLSSSPPLPEPWRHPTPCLSQPPRLHSPASLPVSALCPLPLHRLCSLPGAAAFYLVLLATTCFPFKTKLLHHFMIVCSFISSLIYSTKMCLALSLMLEKWRHLRVYVYWTRKTLSQQYEPFESIGSNFLKLSVPDPCPISSD